MFTLFLSKIKRSRSHSLTESLIQLFIPFFSHLTKPQFNHLLQYQMSSRGQEYNQKQINLNRTRPEDIYNLRRKAENPGNCERQTYKFILPNHSQHEKNIDGGMILRALVVEGNLPKVIDLSKSDFSISNSEMRDLLDDFCLFLCTGYLKLKTSRAMFFLYLGILLNISKLIRQLCTTTLPIQYNDSLWQVLLLVFNSHPSHIPTLKPLLDRNPNFLIDTTNQTQIHRKFPTLLTIQSLQSFLSCLIQILTQNRKLKVSSQYSKLIEVLYKFYVFQNRLPQNTFSSKRINRIIGDNVENRNYDVDEIDEFIRELKRREKAVQAMEGELEREREKAEEEVKRINEKMRKLREEIDKEAQVKPQKRILKVGKVYHRQELKKVCKCAEGIELECRHLACKDCMINWYTDVFYNNKGKPPTRRIGELKCLQTYEEGGKCRHLLSDEEIGNVKEFVQPFQ